MQIAWCFSNQDERTGIGSTKISIKLFLSTLTLAYFSAARMGTVSSESLSAPIA
jgi:hypothetical protein